MNLKKIKHIFLIPSKEDLPEEDFRRHIIRRFLCILLIWYLLIFMIIFITKTYLSVGLLLVPYAIPLFDNPGTYSMDGYVLIRSKYYYFSIFVFLLTIVLVKPELFLSVKFVFALLLLTTILIAELRNKLI